MKVQRIISIVLSVVMMIGIFSCSFSVFAVENNSEIEEVKDYVDNELYDGKYIKDLVPGEDYVENEIIVCCKKSSIVSGALPKITNDYDMSIEYCLSDVANNSMESEETVTYLMTMSNMSTNISNIIEDLEDESDVAYAQPNYIYKTLEETDSSVDIINLTKAKNYNNSQLSMFQTLGSPELWWSSNGGDGIKIAVIDSGIDLNHPALSGCLWNENGIYGYNTTDPDNITAITMSNCNDYAMGHGTHVAGIIGMHSDVSSEYTCKGIAPGAQIIDLQATNDSAGTFKTVSLIAAMEMAVELGADIVNMSLGGQYYDYAWNLVCNRAARSLVIVAAAGNDGFNEASLKNYPAAFSSVIGVMAYGGKKTILMTRIQQQIM